LPASKGSPPALEELSLAFPNLELLEFIGQGGMGFVYKARQPKLNRFVALKILPQSLAADPSFAERFVREGRLLARLSHPQIVSVHDFGQANGFFFLLMEYVDGVNLRQVMKAGRMEPAKALTIVPKLCEALQYAHSEGVLHRDIKPENILLDTKGRVKIADFGIAKLLVEAAGEPELTTGGAALGTPHYMAPEQIERPDQVDHRADVYSLGVVFYEMLTGELPIGRFAPPSEKASVDPRLDDVVLRTLEKERERRTQSAGEVKTQVENVASGQTMEPRDNERSQNPASSAREKRLPVILAVAAAIVLVSSLVMFLKLGRGQSPQGQAALTKEPVTKTVLLTRGTNQFVGDSMELRSVVLWCDTTLGPGEMLLGMVRGADGSLNEARTLLFTRCAPGQRRTSTSFSWFFGPPYNTGFDQSAADLAVAQIATKTSDKPLVLKAGELLEVFSVTNQAGAAMTGYVQFVRSVPERVAADSPSATKPHAIVHIRNHNPHVRSIDYSAAVPSGYALRATASMGEASTFFAPSKKPGENKARPGLEAADYHSSWFFPTLSTGNVRLDPARLRAQQGIFAEQLKILAERGPLKVALGEPLEVFAITNANGEVFQGFLELSDSSAVLNPAPALAQYPRAATRVRSNPKSAASRFPGLDVTTGLPVESQTDGTALPRIDPATGLPVASEISAARRVDPATGLVTPANGSSTKTFAPDTQADLLQEARELANKGEYERALQCYLSYYERSRSSSIARPPLVSALTDWVALGQKYPKARQALTDIQERGMQAFSQGQGSLESFNELLQVNTALHEGEKTVALFKALA
jgi:tRNA A-37 threonylcarbamoyl transferase component Bud32